MTSQTMECPRCGGVFPQITYCFRKVSHLRSETRPVYRPEFHECDEVSA